jgi:hypothetical protein
MGLLDEAIREHLELKRRRGADPGEIARAEHEALEPIFPQEPSEASAQELYEPVRSDAQAAAEAPYEEPIAATPEAPDFASVGQETAELDMQAVLDADHEQTLTSPADTTRPVRAPASRAPQEDSMEWESPGRPDREAVPEEVPGQERLSFE